MIQPRSLSVALNQFRKRRILWNGIVFFQVVCTAAGEQRRYHPSRMAVGWAVVSRLCVRQRSAGTVANGPLANSSPCQRRSNHQNIIGVSEERPKQRALSSIRESLSRVNAISLRYPVWIDTQLLLPPSIRLSCARSTAYVAQHAR